MFRKLCKKPTFLLYRQLHDSKLPSVQTKIDIKPSGYIGKESPKKYDYSKVSSKKIKETPEEIKQKIDNKAEYDDEYSYYLRED